MSNNTFPTNFSFSQDCLVLNGARGTSQQHYVGECIKGTVISAAIQCQRNLLNVLSTFTANYSQSIVSTNNFFTYFYQRKQISRE